MADNGKNQNFFDVDAELESLWNTLHSTDGLGYNGQRPQQPVTQRPQQPVQQRPQQPVQQRPQQPVQQRSQQPVQQRPQQPVQQRSQQPVQQRPQQAAQQRPQQPAQQRPQQPVQQRPQQPVQQRPQQPVQQRPQQPVQQRPQQPVPQRPQENRHRSVSSSQKQSGSIQPKIVSKIKDGIKIYEDKTDYNKIDDSNASYYNGEVYFASQNSVAREPRQSLPPKNENPNLNRRKRPQSRKSSNKYVDKLIRMVKTGPKSTSGYIGILIAASVMLSIFSMSFINDILALNRSSETVTITVEENDTTNKIISKLDKAGLIKHGMLCKMFMSLTGGLRDANGPPVYLSGVYYLTPDMGLEKMLLQCQDTQTAETVTVTIPEGFSVEQIAAKLEKSGVCMRDEFFQNLERAEFSYKFLNNIENKSSRYEYLEGYLYPDTYEFFVGQNASSVINKMLENFSEKWTDEFQARADELGMRLDEVLTLASIVQKEAADSEQMPMVSSVFFNRLHSSNFPSLQSDATNVYVNKYIKPNVTAGEFDTYWSKYSTYACVGLPVGPICNPGEDAIRSVLWPSTTDYYYFCHDAAGNIYMARTEQEHNANYYKTLT